MLCLEKKIGRGRKKQLDRMEKERMKQQIIEMEETLWEEVLAKKRTE